MSGMYGTVKPADIDIDNDVEIFYHYRPSFNSEDVDFNNFKKLNPSILKPCTVDEENINISGLFNLKLPLTEFSKKGLYTIYIRPKEIDAIIIDVGTLAAFGDVRGVVFNIDGLRGLDKDNSLVGYRIEYFSGDKKNGDFKIITSSNRVAITNGVLNTSYGNNSGYYFNKSGQQIFCTVTPSLAPTFKPNTLPYIGTQGEKVKLVNTKFNPVMIELELVEHDEETISYMLEGNQLIDKDKSLITIFNKRGDIYHQSEYGAYKNSHGEPLYEFKKVKNNIDFNQNLENLE